MKLSNLFWVIFLLISHSALASRDFLPQRINFDVFDATTKTKIFFGHELISQNQNTLQKETYYFDLQGIKVQSEMVVYDLASLKTKKYELKNYVSGEIASMNIKNDQISFTYKANGKADIIQNDQLKVSGDQYHGKVLHHLIVRNWEQLESGLAKSFKLLVPFRQEQYAFKIEASKLDPNTSVVTLEPDSWLLRNFVEPMNFYYSITPYKRLTKYVGATTIVTDNNSQRKIEILFSYPESKEGT